MPTIMEVTVQGRLFNQETMNVFNYHYDGVASDPGGLASLLLNGLGWPLWDVGSGSYPDTSVAEAWRLAVNGQFTFELITVRNVYSRTDFVEWLFPIAGAARTGAEGGEATSPALTYAFKSSKALADIKRGARRIAGASEPRIEAGGVISVAGLALLNELASTFSSALPAFGDQFVSCICKKEKLPVLNPDGTPKGRFKYEYFTDIEEQLDNTAFPISWGAVSTIRTQTSRQYGRGR